MLLIGLTTFAYEFLFYCTNFLFRGRIDVALYMRTIILPGTIYALILSLPVYLFLYTVNGKLEAREWSKRKRFP